MADVSGKHFQRIKKIIESNNAIKRSTSATVKQFQALYQDFIAAISTNYEHLGTVKDVADIFLDEEKMRLLEQFEPLQNVQLADAANSYLPVLMPQQQELSNFRISLRMKLT
ncbi:unnamed protein product [Rotaria magnacalcarata]|uniref:Uncharacterized protein n=1 Tax=Rotaria magnacalcarata TaxID=392030 RepID=A0A8S2RZ26_9BILA|nr:unnamed protein product [Rotaria magnacalcarata]